MDPPISEAILKALVSVDAPTPMTQLSHLLEEWAGAHNVDASNIINRLKNQDVLIIRTLKEAKDFVEYVLPAGFLGCAVLVKHQNSDLNDLTEACGLLHQSGAAIKCYEESNNFFGLGLHPEAPPPPPPPPVQANLPVVHANPAVGQHLGQAQPPPPPPPPPQPAFIPAPPPHAFIPYYPPPPPQGLVLQFPLNIQVGLPVYPPDYLLAAYLQQHNIQFPPEFPPPGARPPHHHGPRNLPPNP